MGRRGPPPNPRSIRYEDRKKKPGQTLASIPVDKLGKAVMPDWLKGRAKKFWEDYAPGLEARGLLTALDQAPFTMLCLGYDLMCEASKIVKREGAVITGPRGKPGVHPALRVLWRMENQVLHSLKEFGMTPLSRQRIVVTPPRSVTPEEEEERRKLRNLLGPILVP